MKPEYVLITKAGVRYFITDQVRKMVIVYLEQKRPYIVIEGDVIQLHITPDIVGFGRWFTQEDGKLRIHKHRLCKKCYEPVALGDRCGCTPEKFDVMPEQIALPAPIKEKLHAGIKEFPRLAKGEGRLPPEVLNTPPKELEPCIGHVMGSNPRQIILDDSLPVQKIIAP